MGALAEQWSSEEAGSPAARDEAARPVVALPADGHAPEASSPRWNVLAEELLAYPPRAQRIWLERHAEISSGTGADSGGRSRAYADAWLDRELESLRDRRRVVFGQSSTAQASPGRAAELRPAHEPWSDAGAVIGDPGTQPGGTPRRPERRSAACQSPERRARALREGAARPRTGAALIGPRGLRRLLPGAATLAFLVGAWFGAGALSGLHHQQPDVMPGSVKVSGGYRYDARPGDTLWSIASKLQPGSDPRPLVSRLESQLHGAPLVAGDELTLP